MKSITLPILLTLTSLAAARTDLDGCTKSATVNQWGEASMIWYVPDTGEICDFPDCGGGRAPPKLNQPGCAAYTGTETLTPSYLPGWGPNGKVAPSTSAVSATATATDSETSATSTGAATTSNTKTGSTLITAAPTLSTQVSSSAAGSSSRAGGSSRPASSAAGSSSRAGGSSSSASSGAGGSSSTASSVAVKPTGNVASMPGLNAGVLAVAGVLAGIVAL
ncbi:hypothetical protein BDV32DRAFT_126146 [Aspergillus pseudonomiae]|nr:hypothetical protein BDV32DRAFT_126146 [Aspergillus pseudonomiae]